MYDVIKMFYDEGFYTADDVRVFVRSRDITIQQFKQITGEDY